MTQSNLKQYLASAVSGLALVTISATSNTAEATERTSVSINCTDDVNNVPNEQGNAIDFTMSGCDVKLSGANEATKMNCDSRFSLEVNHDYTRQFIFSCSAKDGSKEGLKFDNRVIVFPDPETRISKFNFVGTQTNADGQQKRARTSCQSVNGPSLKGTSFTDVTLRCE